MYKKFKRCSDFVISLFLLIILIPVFIVVPVLILITMGFPVFFKQERIGFNNKVFQIYKFRTMQAKTQNINTDSKRITWFGKILRISRIDEFPQLLNILKGEMSFIGPRPLLPEYLPYYTKEELRRHEIRPGLSGLSQVSYSYPDWETQFKLDVQYLDNLCFILDLIILLKTIKKIFTPSKKLITGNAGREKFDVYRMEIKESNLQKEHMKYRN